LALDEIGYYKNTSNQIILLNTIIVIGLQTDIIHLLPYNTWHELNPLIKMLLSLSKA